MSTLTIPKTHKNCADCPVHDKLSLQKLGVNAANADYVIALAGNPNTGKSTIFNALTGLRQHTGNWTGKTVSRSEGSYVFHEKKYKVIDLPGTYSLVTSSLEEEIARDFILFGKPDVTVLVVDATRLERNLNLVLQTLQISSRAVVCLNLTDEARKKGIQIDVKTLSRELGVPVVPTVARDQKGIYELLSNIEKISTSSEPLRARNIYDENSKYSRYTNQLTDKIKSLFPDLPNAKWLALRLLDEDQSIIKSFSDGEITSFRSESTESPDQKPIDEVLGLAAQLQSELPEDFHDNLIEQNFREADRIAGKSISLVGKKPKFDRDLLLDKIFLNPILGYPIMFILFALMFWITIAGANVPSGLLFDLLVGKVHPTLLQLGESIGLPWWLNGFLFDGMYLATAWVVSVMLPPMAIFFPMFTLLEDFGYLPRVAFNMDSLFKKAGAHGKQVMTMMMGFGCNAAGVVATRIIDSPRERLIAIITNNFAICNGRWPTQILLASIFIGALVPAHLAGFISAMAVVGVALLGVFLTFVVSWGLSKTVLKGQPSIFSLELPPYRAPKFWQTLYTSLIDRTIFVL
jgi:ferrous iron transport protein B